MDTADAWAVGVVNRNFCETIISPITTPGVFDDVVILTSIDTVANSKNSVIDFVSTILGSDDSSGVTMKDWIVSLNTHRDWANVESSFELSC